MGDSPVQKMPGFVGDSPVQKVLGFMGDSPVQKVPGFIGDSPVQKMPGFVGDSPVQRVGARRRLVSRVTHQYRMCLGLLVTHQYSLRELQGVWVYGRLTSTEDMPGFMGDSPVQKICLGLWATHQYRRYAWVYGRLTSLAT